MIKTFQGGLLLLAVLTLSLAAQAQQVKLSADFGLTFTAERSKVASIDCGCFWLFGGSFDGAVPIYRGLEAAAVVAGGHSTNISPTVDLAKVAFMFGPRYNFITSRWTNRLHGNNHPTSIFGEALFGSAHAFDGAFQTASGAKDSANSLSMQFGGGVNIGMARGFGIRAIELEYARTQFRNFASNTQNDLRLSFGVTYHLGER